MSPHRLCAAYAVLGALLGALLLAAPPAARAETNRAETAALIEAKPVIAPIRLIERRASIVVAPALRFDRDDAGDLRLRLRFLVDLTAARDALAADLERRWKAATCDGDDLSTRRVAIARKGEAALIVGDVRYTRWFSLTNCKLDRNRAVRFQGTARIALRLVARGARLALQAKLLPFRGGDVSKLEVVGLDAKSARKTVIDLVQLELDRVTRDVNREIAAVPILRVLRPTYRVARFTALGEDGLGAELEAEAVVTPERLNAIIPLIE